MASVAQVAKASLQQILVQDAESEFSAVEYQDYMFALNNYMLGLDAQGIALGFTEVSNLGDAVTIPIGALRGVIANMAIEMAPQFNATISPGLSKAATEGMDAMEKLGQTSPVTEFPRNLPRGSGNSMGSRRVSNFYPDSEADILAETTGNIGLEENTI